MSPSNARPLLRGALWLLIELGCIATFGLFVVGLAALGAGA